MAQFALRYKEAKTRAVIALQLTVLVLSLYLILVPVRVAHSLDVQRGETQVTAGNTVVNVGITAVTNTNRAFIVHTYRGTDVDGAQNLQEIFSTAEFTSTTNIRFTRPNTASNNNIAWYVVEAENSEFEVTHGTANFGSADAVVTVNITDIVSTTNAMILVDGYANVDNATRQMFSARFNSSSQVRIERRGTGTAATANFQVIKWNAHVVVQKGTTDVTGTTANETLATAVDLSRTAVFRTRSCDTNGLAQVQPRVWLSSTTQVNFDRVTATGDCTVEWAVVQYPVGVIVQSDNNTSSPATDTLNTTATINSVTLATTFSIASSKTTGTGSAFPRGITTSYLSNATTLTFESGYSGQTTTWTYYVIDTSGWEVPVLNVDIVDASGVSVLSPSISLSALQIGFDCQTSTGTLGTSSQKIRVKNTTVTPGWTLTIAPTSGVTSVWNSGSNTFDFNDTSGTPNGCTDGGDADSLAGLLTVDPSTATNAPRSGCSATGVNFGSSTSFNQGVTDSITLATGASNAQLHCYWDLTGISVSQSIPPQQASGSYTINLTLTVTAN